MRILSLKKNKSSIISKQSDEWQKLIDSFSYPVCVIDMELNIAMANSAMSLLFRKNDWNGNLKYYKFIHSSERLVDNCIVIKTLKSGRSDEGKIYIPLLKKFFIAKTSPVINKGSLTCIIFSAIDITAIQLTENDSDELVEIYTTSINDLKNKALNAEKGRDAFLNMLEDISESYKDLEDLFLKLISVVVNALDAKSPWTKGHSERVSIYAEQIAIEMFVEPDEVKNIRLAGLLHDIGKIGTYDYLLDKPGSLSREEFEIVKKHPAMGAEILKGIKQLNDIVPYIKYHHEKLDGKGYPDSLKGSVIPLGARILHVADSFDSMTSDRPYRPAPGINYALSELEKYRDIQFDRNVVDAFMKVVSKLQGL